MQQRDYDAFTERLRQGLAGDGRVVGLVALGSMSGEPPAAVIGPVAFPRALVRAAEMHVQRPAGLLVLP